jgi:hypothetical protein
MKCCTHFDKFANLKFSSSLLISSLTPEVLNTDPVNNATKVPVTKKKIVATFSKEMDPSTINVTTFTVADTGTSSKIDGSVNQIQDDRRLWKFEPDHNMKKHFSYTAKISREARDIEGNSMGSDYSWSFTTEQ